MDEDGESGCWKEGTVLVRVTQDTADSAGTEAGHRGVRTAGGSLPGATRRGVTVSHVDSAAVRPLTAPGAWCVLSGLPVSPVLTGGSYGCPCVRDEETTQRATPSRGHGAGTWAPEPSAGFYGGEKPVSAWSRAGSRSELMLR